MGAVVQATANELVWIKNAGESIYVRFPMIYPDGSNVMVKVDHVRGGLRISDGGFAHREIENLGYKNSFTRTAKKIAEIDNLDVGETTIYTDIAPEDLYGAMCDVASASWKIVDKVYSSIEEIDIELEDNLTQRLQELFGKQNVEEHASITGYSQSQWDMTAVVHLGQRTAAFKAVGNHATSVYAASTAFHDISSTQSPPSLIAVVRDKQELKNRLTLLSRDANVIEGGQSNEVFLKAAA